jgi:uncharacterized membrane protein
MEIEDIVSICLRIGVSLSVLLTLIGIILIAINGSGNLSISRIAAGSQPASSSKLGLYQAIGGALSLDGTSFIFLGLMVLIATPIIRVALSTFYFAFNGNWLYTIITLIVLFNLSVAIFVIPGIVV